MSLFVYCIFKPPINISRNVMIINHIQNLETARAMLMYSAAKDREASLVEMIGKRSKRGNVFNQFSPGQCCVLQTKPVGEKR